jgi:hypothetical protein
MLRRKSTRIELKRDDLDEYEKAKEMWTKSNESVSDKKGLSGTPASNMLREAERIARVHERIGYIKPQVVPSDGTTHFL